MLTNHGAKNKNNPQYCVVHTITIGGKKPFNTEAREVVRIIANRRMSNEGWLMKELPPITLKDESVLVL
jgi:hypothetical protein